MPEFEGLGAILRRIVGKSDYDYVPETEATKPVCETCGGSGWVTHRYPLGHLLFGQAQPCVCRPAIWGQVFGNFKLDVRYPDLLIARDLTHAWASGEGPPILVLNAERGRGKSHLSKAAATLIRSNGQSADWMTHGDILDRLHGSFGESATGQLMTTFAEARWVIIDDLGQASASETMEGLVDRIIDKRSEAAERGCRTLFTTNLKAEEFSERTASRLRDVRMVASMTIDAPDFRINPIGDDDDN